MGKTNRGSNRFSDFRRDRTAGAAIPGGFDQTRQHAQEVAVPKIVIFKGDAVENETRLAGRAIRLGRDPRNDIVLDDKSVSRFHAEVRPEGDRYVIVDLKSRNGVWVNGQPAKGKVALHVGTPVTLGAFELALEDDVGTGDYEDDPALVPVRRSTCRGGPAGSSPADRQRVRR